MTLKQYIDTTEISADSSDLNIGVVRDNLALGHIYSHFEKELAYVIYRQ